MLADAIRIFEKQYQRYGDAIIIDSYIPDDGEYIIVDINEDNFQILDRVPIKQDKKTRDIDRSNQYFDFIRQADYMSKYLESNKAISDKNIHSNNYLTFFVKKENLHNGKITNEIIEKYYDILRNPLKKYTKPKAKTLYQSFEEQYGEPNREEIGRIEDWVKKNLFSLVDGNSKDKSYLKIFFYYNLDIYKTESQRYILVNIYNNNDYNEIVQGKIYGLPNDNMGMNSKKPYLENKSRKTTVPYLLDQEEIFMQRKFFDYLANKAAGNQPNIYIEEDKIKTYSNDEIPKEDFSGYYMRIKKGKEIEIHDFDTIGRYRVNIKPFDLENVLRLEKSKLEYGKIQTLSTVKNAINEVFFSKFLTTNYFTEAKDLNIKNNSLKRNLLLSRTVLFTWFYKGNEGNTWKVLKQSSLDLIKGAIENGYLLKAGEQFNLRCGLKNHFEGGETMGDILIGVKNLLRTKIIQDTTEAIQNDREYFFAVGQLTNYFISLSKTKNKVHSLANPIINAKTDGKIKEQLRQLYKKYNYTINIDYKRFKNLFAMVSSYVPEGKVDEDLIIAGYLHSNLLYESTKKEGVDKDE